MGEVNKPRVRVSELHAGVARIKSFSENPEKLQEKIGASKRNIADLLC